MCGIVGFFEKNNLASGEAASAAFRMLTELDHRGPDSVGMAIYGAPRDGHFKVRINLGTDGPMETATAKLQDALAAVAQFENPQQTGTWLTLDLPDAVGMAAVDAAVASLDCDAEVVSIGRSMEIAKQVGAPTAFERDFHFSGLPSSHALGHTRLSTESRVDLCHSQPFWGHIYPDLAIVHNGHITNYHKLRRQYEQRGVKFYTENDSEIIAVYLGEHLMRGSDLEAGLRAMLSDFDGSYSCLAATDKEFGFVRDRFAFKPLAIAENGECVAVATEEIAIRAVIPNDCPVREVNAREVRVWRH
jgi:methylamine---glutamate N-methyltransferase subunit A